LNRGDSHYWGVWHGEEPFQVYAQKLPRFSSEYGFQAFPPMETIEGFTEPEDQDLNSPVLLVHQKHPIGNELITDYMGRDYPVPDGFEDFVYVSQLLQARGMRIAFEAHRRAMPRTMGTLYWQLNDTWPVISWSGRDYFGRWKALHHAARDAFAPVLLSPVLDGDTLKVWGVSDRLEPVSGTLRLSLLTFDGRILWQASTEAPLSPTTSSLLWQDPVSEVLGGADPASVVLVAQLEDDEARPLAKEGLLYFRVPRSLALEVPTIRIESETVADGIRLTLVSDVLAKGVYLQADGVRFGKNFFDLLPERPFALTATSTEPMESLEERLAVRTLAEVPREGTSVEENSGG
jgi:beta-mannosidase